MASSPFRDGPAAVVDGPVEASCTLRAPLAAVLTSLLPALVFGAFAASSRVAAANARGFFVAGAIASLVLFYANVMPRTLRVASGELASSGPFGTRRTPLSGLERVEIETTRRGRGGVTRTLVFHFEAGVRFRLPLPTDAPPEVDLSRVLQAVARVAPGARFDPAADRIRLGVLSWE